ncbi:hypothetical protein M409DRAFT_54722 [Zasmidium cellare ATCC 36951]|uniref:Mur ligase central domain-containing protein n=1 Tax=Zasmidium cellare ATCC 36951 TaxID=1080233 RepID=A0A6A6CM10_ZASCE|nr:uncharacterized protein M409DRAFT_54722 [Zasmidium cellare ATCC 36951]KAF2166962.1 hypothetical protein M409DRAFT_54722 [Zasmidium cellare ATCC 36951]
MIELGLQRISRLLAPIPLPWRAIHIAGTNGKGSVCAYISEMLATYNRSAYRQHLGHPPIRHGRYTSPHVVDRWDCITLSNGDGEGMEVVKKSVFEEVERDVLKRNERLEIGASEFELLTATAFEIFTRSKLDVAVIETGMGGRLDATNVLGQPPIFDDDADRKDLDMDMPYFRPPPLVTGITKVGLDHQGFLGDTIEAIAREKAGIFKPRMPATWDTTNLESVQDVLRDAASKTLSETFFLSAPVSATKDDPDHVRANMDVAYATAQKALSRLGRINGDAHASNTRSEELEALYAEMATSHRRVVFPGRLEWIDISNLTERHNPALLDGAHNAQSAEVLGLEVEKLRNTSPSTKVTWLLAASDTKDVKEILKPLIREGDSVLAVEFGPVDGMPWVKPMDASAIVSTAEELVPSLRTAKACGSDVHAAVRAAVQESGNGNLVIAGSLYLVGDVHRLLRSSKPTK